MVKSSGSSEKSDGEPTIGARGLGGDSTISRTTTITVWENGARTAVRSVGAGELLCGSSADDADPAVAVELLLVEIGTGLMLCWMAQAVHFGLEYRGLKVAVTANHRHESVDDRGVNPGRDPIEYVITVDCPASRSILEEVRRAAESAFVSAGTGKKWTSLGGRVERA